MHEKHHHDFLHLSLLVPFVFQVVLPRLPTDVSRGSLGKQETPSDHKTKKPDICTIGLSYSKRFDTCKTRFQNKVL